MNAVMIAIVIAVMIVNAVAESKISLDFYIGRN